MTQDLSTAVQTEIKAIDSEKFFQAIRLKDYVCVQNIAGDIMMVVSREEFRFQGCDVVAFSLSPELLLSVGPMRIQCSSIETARQVASEIWRQLQFANGTHPSQTVYRTDRGKEFSFDQLRQTGLASILY